MSAPHALHTPAPNQLRSRRQTPLWAPVWAPLWVAPWVMLGALWAACSSEAEGDPSGAGKPRAPGWETSPCGAQFCADLEATQAFNPSNGRGVALVDVDGDGWEDLWRSSADGELGAIPLLRNEKGRFVAWDIAPPPARREHNWSGAWGDLDNDGDPDLVILNGGYAGTGTLAVYRNDVRTGGGLTDVTEGSGLSTEQRAWWGGSFADLDGDGYLDLAVTAVRRLDNSALGTVEVYRNRGDASFERLPALEPLGAHSAKNPVWIDYDGDGDPDLFVPMQADDWSRAHERLYRNDNGTFSDVSTQLPTNLGDPSPLEFVAFHGTFSAAAADFDQDGRDDLYLGRWTQQDVIWLNRPEGFVEVSRDVGLDMSPDVYGQENTMGLGVGDFTGDGFPDVFVGTGEPHAAYLPLAYCSQNERFGFERCSKPFVAGHGATWHHGVALGDIDHDGDVDLLLNLGGHKHPPEDLVALPSLDDRRRPILYRQYSAKEPQTAALRLRGVRSNADAVGARLEIVGERTHYATVRSMQGFQSLNSAWQTVRVAANGPSTVNIRWPSGERTTLEVQRGDRLTVNEDGRVQRDD